ncbi:MAG: Crp/Fnr family transcriptional regulator [Okeania sp. SIO2G4]|uniref:Crp/Fnr family transcriptional regulator n=1 Tax=unclassified Okeania TaxID=2634635 RepID=UPI0013BB2490|nr:MULTISPECIES: Crp/Fnr family transcriptional regulator [unclassified Okeania]NEP73161.1 Crp/Fnr family transcriptional regulator [Okeania sp. SIO2G5]NEP94024.1 Crp/Fnr family transcriptional regulator [Okeania sp. SIO2F5]NEQ91856.1 Crp/Fnr family transcriptional regulator [Okeania sp. SIO2G4]
MNKAIAQTIASTFPFWENLDSEAKTNFLNECQQISLSPSQFVCLEGDICHHLPLIISGNVRVYKIGESGREITLYHLEKGDSCIMTASCIISQKVFPAFAIAETEVEALIIPANSLKKWVMHNTIWQEYIFGILSQRLANVIEIIEEVAFRRMDSRIASYLLHNVNSKIQTLQITHEAIAQELGSSREVVSRILKTFERQKLLSLSRGKIELYSWEKLEKIAQLGKY